MKIKHVIASLITVFALSALIARGATDNRADSDPAATDDAAGEARDMKVPDGFVLVKGGTFMMGSPESEAWRGADEKQREVTVSDFYVDGLELTQSAYKTVMGNNPSRFPGDKRPVENISWLDAIAYCNARSELEGLTPAYVADGTAVTWNRAADGYRLLTEAEWEYACRAGTLTPFNTGKFIDPKEANYYGHYPYGIEENYFSRENLEVKPGEYRQSTVEVGSFSPNEFGLFDAHGNVGEWVWDYHGEYAPGPLTDPAGPDSGSTRVYRGGGWNDFAKHLRSAYRATMAAGMSAINAGTRIARNAAPGSGSAGGSGLRGASAGGGGGVLIAYFSWGGNTRGIAAEIRRRTGADSFEIKPAKAYSTDYNTVLDEAQRDQRRQARPELAGKVDGMEGYDVVLLGYPNWWGSIPMPVATFLESHDFSGKRIVPFCSHGGGRFGQSLTAISKLAPNAVMGEPLSVGYSGGSGLGSDIVEWLKKNGIRTN
ncbi:MAG: SUMF1/EgtB/PvdO family nonheme iron enzyme [Deltaproteobacteria bacterium]|jgi:formylglycine-generating enzyme required for sulfatase activity/flavodoxin|nr:SUMF1/EgtB/PvdO family nonheme iron enzyme [Deltaproteobacteria bacterium]